MIFKQILSTNFSRKYMEASQENLYVDDGTERVKKDEHFKDRHEKSI